MERRPVLVESSSDMPHSQPSSRLSNMYRTGALSPAIPHPPRPLLCPPHPLSLPSLFLILLPLSHRTRLGPAPAPSDFLGHTSPPSLSLRRIRIAIRAVSCQTRFRSPHRPRMSSPRPESVFSGTVVSQFDPGHPIKIGDPAVPYLLGRNHDAFRVRIEIEWVWVARGHRGSMEREGMEWIR
jgi:hypothetical protein